jgi:hypothetical protein
MNRFYKSLLVAVLALGTTSLALAKMMPNIEDKPTRFSGSCCVYTGAPALPVTLSMIVAGGGPSDFKTAALVGVLAGDKAGPEVAKLKKQFGDEQVASFLKTFDFVVADSLKIVKEKNVALPSTPMPDPKDGKALAAALWGAGQTGKGFNVEVMLDRAVSHPIHTQVMLDIDKEPGLGLAADANYHAVLTQAMKDLASVYGLK